MKKIPKFKGFNLSNKDFYEMSKTNQLFRMGIKVNTPVACNWACPYCYVGSPEFKDRPRTEKLKNGMPEPFKDPEWPIKMAGWIDQGVSLGAKAVTINGTFEPLTAPHHMQIIDHCVSKNLLVTFVTNGALMDESKLNELNDRGVNILTKLNVPFVDSSDPRYEKFCEIHKTLSGAGGTPAESYEKQKRLIYKLMEAGFNRDCPEGQTRLGVESVITQLNIEYLPELITQLRAFNLYSHIEVTKVQGFAKNNEYLVVSKERLESFFHEILDQDIAQGYEAWIPRPPYVAGVCYENMMRVDVHADGTVKPCPGIETPLGNLYETSFKDILESQWLTVVRNLGEFIQGDCKKCELMESKQCYGGCRGTAYQSLKNAGKSEWECLVASDPSCQRVKTVLDNGLQASEVFGPRNVGPEAKSLA